MWLRLLRPLGCLAVALCILIVVLLLIQLGLWLWQPMFHNSFMPHTRAGFFVWAPPFVYFDDRGNAAVADYRRNLLVVFLTADSSVSTVRFRFPHSKDGGAAFPAVEREDTIDFFVPDTTNTLFVFGADGRRKDFPLQPGEAERNLEWMQWQAQPPNLVPFVEQAYADNHPDSVASLKETIAELETPVKKGADNTSKESEENGTVD
jgi:hypothetical protein